MFFRFFLLILLGYIFYKFFKLLAENKQSSVKGPANRQEESFQQKYKDLIEDADFEEIDGDPSKE